MAMTENFESDAHDYLLNQMDSARRAAFERELQRNPSATAALKACADTLAGFALETARPEPLGPADQRATLEAILDATRRGEDGRAAAPLRPTAWARWLWPAAAAILLGLNLVEFQRPFAPTPDRPATVTVVEKDPAARSPETRSTTTAAGASGTSTEKTSTLELARASPGASPEAQARELERLRANVAELERARQRLRAEYDALVDRITNTGVANRELNRLTTMELVDAVSFNRGERKGLVGVGRGILTEPGVVIATEPPPGPVTGSTVPPPRLPYAWSVFDEKEQRGYLNLYNLPNPSPDQAMQAWVRPADSREFQRVGEVPPQLHGGNGSLQYVLPSNSATPAEILITIESRATPPAIPTGPTVLRGP